MENNVEYLIGQLPLTVRPMQPYSDEIIEFMDCFSKELRKRATKSHMADLSALSFWCRKGNIAKLKEQGDFSHSIGRGLIFHVTPSNVPINFAFSYFFGLLSGNANIVRVPNKDFPQITEIIDALKVLLKEERFHFVAERTVFVRYGHEKEINDYFSEMADGRIIWGGDRTIEEIRKSPMKPKSTEIVFADRYSFGIISTEKMLSATEEERHTLAEKFYNDTYLMDQNACSTPHLIVWIGEKEKQAQSLFWNEIALVADRYSLEPIKSVDKYTDLCMLGMSGKLEFATVNRWGNRLYTVNVNHLPEEIDTLRGRYGMFYQVAYKTLDDLKREVQISSRAQTVLYFGVDASEILSWVMDSGLMGIDRIVPFGSSLDMNTYWDGYDIIGQLSRRVEVQ